MRKWLIKYSLEIFSTIVLLFVMVNMLLVPELSYIRKLAIGFAILAVLHEFEEKRTPGGFYELMTKKFGIPTETANLDLASFFVICYWTALIVLSFVFDNLVVFLIMPVALGFFEAFVHTAGIWIHHMKKPYTPGLLSAWLMAGLSVFSICYLNTLGTVTAIDYLLGTILMVVGFAIMECGSLYALNTTFKNIRNNIKKIMKSK